MATGESTSNSIGGAVSGVSIQARNITGDVSITQVVGNETQPDPFGASDLSVAVPEVVAVRRIRGRDELLANLLNTVDGNGGRVVLSGAGGNGKSAIAYTVARDVGSRRTVWWVDATSRETLVSGLFEVAVQAGVSRADARQVWRNGESAMDLLWHVLNDSGTRPWLLVVDNADDPTLLDGWIRNPEKRDTVLITSRDQESGSWGRDVFVHVVQPISDADGAAVLTELAPDAGSERDARSLARRLGGIPIALTLVGHYLASTSVNPVLPESGTPTSFVAYERDLEAEFPAAISRLPEGNGGIVLSAIWERSLVLLERNGVTLARPLLRLIAFFAASTLPVTVLRASVLKNAPRLFSDVEATRLETAVAGMVGLGLLRHDRPGVDGWSVGAVALHPLVRELVKAQSDVAADAPLYLTVRIGLLLAATLELDAKDHRTWPTWRLLLPHCTFDPLDIKYAHGDEYLLHVDVACQAAEYARLAGLWDAAEPYYRMALTLLAKSGSPADADAVVIRHNLAYLKRDQGRYVEAESDFREILADCGAVFGWDHPNMLATRHELARVLYDRGEVDVAERELALLVREMTRALGPEHENTLSARHEHARTLGDQGLLDEAYAEFERVSSTAATVFGASSSVALNSRHELAVTLLRLGELDRARSEFGAVLDIEVQALGSAHPSTLVTRAELAEVWMAQGELDAAEAEFRGVLAVWTQIGYRDHPHAIVVRNDLATIMMAKGHFAVAETEIRRVVAVATETLGPEHSHTLRARGNLALALQQQGRLVDAEAELRRLLPTTERVLGAHDQNTIANRRQLAEVLYEAGKPAAAIGEFRRVAEAQMQVFGGSHPETLDTRSRLGAMLLAAGDVAGARSELGIVVPLMADAFGVANERSLAARVNLAQACALLGDVARAVRELRHALVVARAAGGLEELISIAETLLRQFER